MDTAITSADGSQERLRNEIPAREITAVRTAPLKKTRNVPIVANEPLPCEKSAS
jgi:hypothetical protein